MTKPKKTTMTTIFLYLPAIPGILSVLLLFNLLEWAWSAGIALSPDQLLWAITLTLPVGFPLYCLWFHWRRLGNPIEPAFLYLLLSPMPIGVVTFYLCGVFSRLWHWKDWMPEWMLTWIVIPVALLAILMLFLTMSLFSLAVYHLFARLRKD